MSVTKIAEKVSVQLDNLAYIKPESLPDEFPRLQVSRRRR